MRIATYDGGGVNGLTPALVSGWFEKHFRQHVADLCDLIAGTSTGGIIALALAAGIPAQHVAEFYLERGPAIFSRSLRKRLVSVGGLADELYDAGELEVALYDLFGDRTFADVRTRVMVTAFDIESREPVLLRSWGGENYRLADLARATSAAPTYFEPFRLCSLSGEAMPLIDGGVVANNPAMLAYVEARRMQPDAAIRLVSLGTGRNDMPCLYGDAKDFGLAQWAPHLLDIMFSGGAELVHDQCAALLGDSYVRLQADLPRQLPMDATDAESFAVRRLAADRLIESAAAKTAVEMMGVA